jgi:hypothetical protein
MTEKMRRASVFCDMTNAQQCRKTYTFICQLNKATILPQNQTPA